MDPGLGRRAERPRRASEPASPPEGSAPGSIAGATPAIHLDAVGFSYPTHPAPRPALAPISLDVAPGEFVALIGANGTGKSTLLRLVAGLLVPTAGEVTVAGGRVDGASPRVGLVFQEPRLLPWRSTLDNVAFPLELAGWPPDRRRARARELLALVGLDGVDDVRPHELSGGMRQRASIARALAIDPAVLLLDEPFSALDAITRDRFNLELQDVWRGAGTTVVLVTHSISEAVLLSDRVVVLAGHPGRVAVEITVPIRRPRLATDMDEPEMTRLVGAVREVLEVDGARTAAGMVR
jgi:NitT/TauT family transport system ATP-binding protein